MPQNSAQHSRYFINSNNFFINFQDFFWTFHLAFIVWNPAGMILNLSLMSSYQAHISLFVLLPLKY